MAWVWCLLGWRGWRGWRTCVGGVLAACWRGFVDLLTEEQNVECLLLKQK